MDRSNSKAQKNSLAKIVESLCREEDKLDDLQRRTATSVETVMGLCLDALEACGDEGSSVSREKNGLAERVRLLKDAERGARRLKITPRSDGKADVSIDGEAEFELPETLYQFLDVLAEDIGPSEDDKVGWKSFQEVAALLECRVKRTFTRHAVTQLVHRLRTRLRKRNENPMLVQTRKGLLRFALVREKRQGVVTEDDMP